MTEGNQDLIHVKPEDVGKQIPVGVTEMVYQTGDVGRIADVGAAQELAAIESPLRDAAEARAAVKEKELAGGLTPVEEENLKVVEKMNLTFAHAFVGGQEPQYDAKGRPFLITKTTDHAPTLVIGREGVAILTRIDRGDYEDTELKSLRLEGSTSLPYIGLMVGEKPNGNPMMQSAQYSYHEMGGVESNYKVATVGGKAWGRPYRWESVRDAAPTIKDWLQMVNKAHENDPTPTKPAENVMDLFK